MAEPVPSQWQLQEAKQRFSEVIRAVVSDGPQVITRHGEEIAVIIDIAEYHRLTAPEADLTEILLAPSTLDDAAAVLDQIEAERKHDVGREINLEAAT
jgi:prevent-host-death family protein